MQAPALPRIVDFQQFYSDIEALAELAEVPCKRDVFEPILEVYKTPHETGVSSFRTTNRPVGKRELDVRYVNMGFPHDPYQMALDHGYVKEVGHPVESLMREIQTYCPVGGYGVDVSVNRGFTKIWSLFSETFPAAEMLKLPSMPPAAKRYTELWDKYNLKQVTLVAIDFVSRNFNMYFLFRNPENNLPNIAGNLIRELGFKLPSTEEQAIFSGCGDLHFTFTWDSPTCDRLSFVVPHAPESQFPTHLDPLFPHLFASFPTLFDERYASIQSAYSLHHGDYLKIEMDYTGITMALAAAMSINE